jgi:hypothetical protein
MSRTPAVNPNVHDIADRAKHEYATGTQVLAALHYRLAELAGTGRIDPDESKSLQRELHRVWEALYFGTVYAVRDEDTDDWTWAEADNTYSDGRTVMTQIRIEPRETSELNWEHNKFTNGDGAVNEHPLGTICCIAHHDPKRDQVVDDRPQQTSLDLESLRRLLLQRWPELRDKANPTESDGEDEIE